LQESNWFKQGIGRPVYEHEQEFFTKVVEIFDKECPSQVNPLDTFLTGEGNPVLILIIPHHCLDGVSLVLWHEENHISIRWSHIGNLSTHDAIDFGIITHYIGKHPDWLNELSECLRGEFNREIIIRCKYSKKSTVLYCAKYYLHLYGERYIGRTIKGINHLRCLNTFRNKEFKTSLALTDNLPFCLKPKLSKVTYKKHKMQ